MQHTQHQEQYDVWQAWSTSKGIGSGWLDRGERASANVIDRKRGLGEASGWSEEDLDTIGCLHIGEHRWVRRVVAWIFGRCRRERRGCAVLDLCERRCDGIV